MSEEEHELVSRLLDAARADTASDEAQRQARLYENVLAKGQGGGGGEGGLRSARSGLGLVVAGVAALALVGAGAITLARPASSSREARVPINASESSAAVPSAAPSSGPDEVLPGTSVWELPSAASAKKLVAPSTDIDELALELGALEHARKRLREHDTAGTMTLLDDFDRRFPHPRAGDEVTVLRVEVLLALGRHDEAHHLGTDFIARHPESIYRARIAQLLGDASP